MSGEIERVDPLLIDYYMAQENSLLEAEHAGKEKEALEARIRCECLLELIHIEMRDASREGLRLRATAFDVVKEALFDCGDVLLVDGRYPMLEVNNAPGTQISLTGKAADALKAAGITHHEGE